MDEVKSSPEIKEVAISKEPIKSKKNVLVFYIVLSFIFGVIGGGFYDKVLMPFIEKVLGKNGNVVISDKIENVTVKEDSAVVNVAESTSSSVVSIIGKKNITNFFGGTEEQKGSGTGFVLTADGMVATNKHVVEDEDAQYTIVTSDGGNYDAEVLARDPLYDLAVLKIDAKNLHPIDLGNSDDLKVGQHVVAIGNALGQYQNSVTSGVISGKGRPVVASDATGGSEVLEDLLQTDAAINPGNSGGPLIDLTGRVVGINTAIADSAQSIGFAIPINLVKPAIDSVTKTGKIIHPVLGVRYISITKDMASLYKLSSKEGALVYSGSLGESAVVAGSPASKAGLKEGDIITSFAGQKIDENHSLFSAIQKNKPGDEVKVIFLRDGKESTVSVTLSSISS